MCVALGPSAGIAGVARGPHAAHTDCGRAVGWASDALYGAADSWTHAAGDGLFFASSTADAEQARDAVDEDFRGNARRASHAAVVCGLTDSSAKLVKGASSRRELNAVGQDSPECKAVIIVPMQRASKAEWLVIERRQAFVDDPRCDMVEPHQARCLRCHKWVRTGQA